MLSLNTKLVGAKYRGEDVVALVELLDVGTELVLQREAENLYDRLAVKVLHENIHIGYIPKQDNEELSSAMDAGRQFICTITGFLTHDSPALQIEEVSVEAEPA